MIRKAFMYVGILAMAIIACNNPQNSAPVAVSTTEASVAPADVPAAKEVAMKIMEALKNKDYNAYTACGRTESDMKFLMKKMPSPDMTEEKMEEMVKQITVKDQEEMKKTFDDFIAACETNKIDLTNAQITIGEETVNEAMGGVQTMNVAIELKDAGGIYTSAVDLIMGEKGWVINFPGATTLMKQ